MLCEDVLGLLWECDCVNCVTVCLVCSYVGVKRVLVTCEDVIRCVHDVDRLSTLCPFIVTSSQDVIQGDPLNSQLLSVCAYRQWGNPESLSSIVIV